MGQPVIAPYYTLLRGGMRPVELFTSRGLLSVISKYAHQRAWNTQNIIRSDRSHRRRNETLIFYVLGMTTNTNSARAAAIKYAPSYA